MDDGDDSPASNSYPVAWGSKLNLWSVLQRSGGGCLISASPGKDDCGSTPNSAHSSSASTVAPSSTRSTPELRSERAADAGSKRKEDSDASRKLNVLEGTFTMANYLLNCGTFGVPFVFLLSGEAAVGLIFIATSACALTGLLLSRVLEQLAFQERLCLSLIDVARAAGGAPLAVIIDISSLAELFGYAIANLLVLGHTLRTIVPGLDYGTVIIISTVTAMLQSTVPDKMYSYISAFSSACLATVCVVVLASGWQMPQWADDHKLIGPLPVMPHALTLLIFTVGCHPVLPSLFNGMSSRSDFDRAVTSGFILWAFFATAFGASAYFMFGGMTQNIATRNIGVDLELYPVRGATYLAVVTSVLLTFKLQMTQVPNIRPIVQSIAGCFGFILPPGKGGLLGMAAATPILLICALGGWYLRNSFELLCSVSGLVPMTLNSLIFPCLAYWRICFQPIS